MPHDIHETDKDQGSYEWQVERYISAISEKVRIGFG